MTVNNLAEAEAGALRMALNNLLSATDPAAADSAAQQARALLMITDTGTEIAERLSFQAEQLKLNVTLIDAQRAVTASLVAQRTWLSNWKVRAISLLLTNLDRLRASVGQKTVTEQKWDVAIAELVNENYTGGELYDLHSHAIEYKISDHVYIMKLNNVWVLQVKRSAKWTEVTTHFPSAEAAYAYFLVHPQKFMAEAAENTLTTSEVGSISK